MACWLTALAWPALMLGALIIIACAGELDSQRSPAASGFTRVFVLNEPLSVTGLGGAVSNSVRYDLPSSARQGGDGWYILDLKLTLVIHPEAPLGAVNYVSVSTNGRAAAQIKFVSDRIAGYPAVRWSTTELFTGSSKGMAFGTSLTLSYSNYLQLEGVRPGENVLTLKLEQLHGIVVRSVTLEPGSSVSKGRLGPPRLTLDVNGYPRRVKVGQVFTVQYRVTNEGYPARDVGVTATTSGIGLLAVGPASRFHGWLPSEDRGRMAFVAIAPGDYVVNIRAKGATGGAPQQRLEIRAR